MNKLQYHISYFKTQEVWSIRHRFDRWQVSLFSAIVLMLLVVMALSLYGAVYAWSPGAGQNVVVDNGYSFSGKTTTGTERPMLTFTNANAVRLNAPPAGAIFFTVANTEMMRIANNGNVGIGDTTPGEAKLVVYAASGDCLRCNRWNGTYASMATSNGGVYGYSAAGEGVSGESSSGKAVYGECTGTGYAGYFDGKVHVAGALSKSSGSFKIDHPQDPENKYLSHSFVESPDMMNVYNGNVFLDEKGEAEVQLPSYFEALNRDFRYQLTCIGGFAPVYVAQKISGNAFRIAGGTAGMEVSWQVTGVRQDAFACAHPIVVEEEKPDNEKGLYLNPREWGQPEEKGINAAQATRLK